MTENKKRNIIIGALCGVLLLMVVGYAAFSSILNIKGTTNISSNWDIRITSVTSKNVVGSASNAEDPDWDDLTATFKTNLEVPGDSIEYDVTVENKGTLNAKLDKINMTVSNNPAIKFTTTGLTEGDKLNAGSSAVLTVKVEYLTGVEVDNKNLSANLTVTLDYVQSNVGEGGIAMPPASDKLTENVVTEGDGLYEDEYETGRYVYRGANPDNYITFNDELWRIISVENDGTLKIIRKDDLGNRAFDTSSNNWAKPATLNTYLNDKTDENSYYNKMLSSEAKGLIQGHIWGIGVVKLDNTDLAAQIQSENSTTWIGNIGLISASDFIRANSNTTQCGNMLLQDDNKAICKTTNYLIPTSGPYWTISPYSAYPAGVLIVYSDGFVDLNYAHYVSVGLLPAVYIKSNISLEGKGTDLNPYTIITQ